MLKLRYAAAFKNLKEGLDPRNLIAAPAEIVAFFRDYRRFRRSYPGRYPVRLLPVFFERNRPSVFDPHYLYQAYWATDRILHGGAPPFHVDIASHLSFAAQLAALVPVIQLEFSPPAIRLAGYHRVAGDILRLPFRDHSLPSLTCLHVIEHIGLGRYGDPVDGRGCWQGLKAVARVLAPGGKLLLSAPVGRPAVYFNGGYVYDPEDIAASLPGLDLVEFSCVGDDRRFREHVSLRTGRRMVYALGLFHFRKPAKED